MGKLGQVKDFAGDRVEDVLDVADAGLDKGKDIASAGVEAGKELIESAIELVTGKKEEPKEETKSSDVSMSLAGDMSAAQQPQPTDSEDLYMSV